MLHLEPDFNCLMDSESSYYSEKFQYKTGRRWQMNMYELSKIYKNEGIYSYQNNIQKFQEGFFGSHDYFFIDLNAKKTKFNSAAFYFSRN